MAKKTKEEAIAAKESAEWQAREDLRTLKVAEEIRGDRARLNAARKEAKRQMDALTKTVKSNNAKKTKRPRKK